MAPGTPGLALIERAFGLSVIAEDGSLDRQALGAIVFADPDARSVLNGITHPAVWARARSLIEAAQEADPDAVVVYDQLAAEFPRLYGAQKRTFARLAV